MLTITEGKLNLGKYEDVTSDKWRDDINNRIQSGNMPVAPSERWSYDMKAIYQKWINDGYPQG